MYIKNVTVSNIGVFPGRSGEDCVRNRAHLPVSLESELYF